MITAFRALVRKDIQLFLVDRRALLMSFAVPIAIGSFFGFIFGGQSNQAEASRIPVLVVDQDRSAISAEITKSLAAEKTLEVKSSGLGEARAAVRKGDTIAAIVIPPNFGQDAGAAFFGPRPKPEITVLYDPSRSAERAMVQGILTGDVMQSVSKEMFGGATGRTMVDESLAQIEQSRGLSAENRKTLTDLLRSVQRLNQQADASPDPPGTLVGGLKMPFSARQEAVTSRVNTQ
jgi:ABC-2 type transport system permease protein